MIKFLTTRLSVIVMAWADREEGVRGAGGGVPRDSPPSTNFIPLYNYNSV